MGTTSARQWEYVQYCRIKPGILRTETHAEDREASEISCSATSMLNQGALDHAATHIFARKVCDDIEC